MSAPNITVGQVALDPYNKVLYYRKMTGEMVSTSLDWLLNGNNYQQMITGDEVTISNDLTVSNDLIVNGNLTINGTTTTVNVEQVTIEDNILILNSNVSATPNTNAGIEIERGNQTNVQLLWNESTDKWQFTNDGITYYDISSIIADSVTLGYHTVGDYIKNLTAGTGVTITNNSGEGATPTIAIGQPVETTSTVTFTLVNANLTGNVTGNVTGNLTGNVTGNVTGTVSNISNHGINDLSDVTITSSADGDFLRWTGSAWVNDAVNLTSDTVGDYVKNLVQGNGITISNNSGEGATPNIAIDTSVVQTRVTNITDTEIGYLDGVTSGVQAQLDTKAPTAGPTFTGTTTLPSTTSIGSVSDTEIGYLDGVTSGIQSQINTKAPTADPTFTGTVSGISKSMVGLGNVDNTSDVNKPVSTAQQTALDLKANSATPTFTGTVSGITKSMVGLGSVDNTADTAKPVSTAQQAALDLKANSATPTFTGMATIPKITVGGIEIDTTSPADTNVLKYSSSLNKYIPGVATVVATLDDLTDVIAPSPSPDQVLSWDTATSKWVNKTFSASVETLDAIGNVSALSPSSGDYLKWDGASWVNSAASYSATIGDGSSTSFVLTHNLNTREVVVSLVGATSPYESYHTDWNATTENTITVYFASAPGLNSIKVKILS